MEILYTEIEIIEDFAIQQESACGCDECGVGTYCGLYGGCQDDWNNEIVVVWLRYDIYYFNGSIKTPVEISLTQYNRKPNHEYLIFLWCLPMATVQMSD